MWIFDDTGTLINPAGNTVDPGLPDGYDSAPVAPSASSRIVVMQLVPKVPDPRFNQTITLSTVINANRISS